MKIIVVKSVFERLLYKLVLLNIIEKELFKTQTESQSVPEVVPNLAHALYA